MKKILYIAMLAFTLTLSFTSCTDEVVKPKADNTGGVGSDPIKR